MILIRRRYADTAFKHHRGQIDTIREGSFPDILYRRRNRDAFDRAAGEGILFDLRDRRRNGELRIRRSISHEERLIRVIEHIVLRHICSRCSFCSGRDRERLQRAACKCTGRNAGHGRRDHKARDRRTRKYSQAVIDARRAVSRNTKRYKPFGKRHAADGGAAGKDCAAKFRKSFGKLEIRQLGAVHERAGADGIDACGVGKRDLRQPGTVSEPTVADLSTIVISRQFIVIILVQQSVKGFTDLHRGERMASGEYAYCSQIAVHNSKPVSSCRRQRNALQLAAPAEGIVPGIGKIELIGQPERGQRRTIPERVIADQITCGLVDRIAEIDGRELAAILEGIGSDRLIIFPFTAIRDIRIGEIIGKRDRSQFGAAAERIVLDAQAEGKGSERALFKGDRLERRTICKRISADPHGG